MLGRIDMRFNPKYLPLDSGSGAGMTVMQRSPSARTREGVDFTPILTFPPQGGREREQGMGPRMRDGKEGGLDCALLAEVYEFCLGKTQLFAVDFFVVLAQHGRGSSQ